LCSVGKTIQDGLHAVSCSCAPLSFNGTWQTDVIPNNMTNSSNNTCFQSNCSESLSAQSIVCNGPSTALVTFEANLTFTFMDVSCVTVSVFVISGHVYTSSPQSPLALPFLPTNYNLVGDNIYAVVENGIGVVVGQIHGAMIQIIVQNLSSIVSYDLQVSPCLLLDPNMLASNQTSYDVFDVGILTSDGKIFPLGFQKNFVYMVSQNVMICFENITISDSNTSLILIQRVSNYENFHAYTSGEESAVMVSAVLFSFGSFLLIACHLCYSRSIPILIIGVQSVCLLLLRGIYFYLLASGEIPVGGLLDFALIEIPTFIYIGIFLQIIFPAYRFFFAQKHAINISNKLLSQLIAISLLLNWLIFAAIMITLASSQSFLISGTRSCNCQISDPPQQSHVAQIIRIVYKSIVLAIAIWVIIIIFVFQTQVLKAGGIQELYHQIAFLSFGLFFDCMAFVIYYSANTPNAYFLIVLWFTELIPICSMNIVIVWVTKTIRFKLF
jgi:hypothetical protein